MSGFLNRLELGIRAMRMRQTYRASVKRAYFKALFSCKESFCGGCMSLLLWEIPSRGSTIFSVMKYPTIAIKKVLAHIKYQLDSTPTT